MHKRQEGKNVKTFNEFFYDPTKVMCFECKTRRKVYHIMKTIKLSIFVFFSNKLWFLMEHFIMNFLGLGLHTFIFPSLCLHSLKVLHNKWHSCHYVCIMWKYLLKDLVHQKRKDVIFSLMFFIYIFLAKNLIWYMFWYFD
jgi:hypothetical protein